MKLCFNSSTTSTIKMLEPRDVADKKLNAETHRLVGEVQLLQYGYFLDKYNTDSTALTGRLSNNLNIRLKPILLENSRSESVSLLHLVHSDNKLLSRILVSLASICEEIMLLVEEAREYYVTFMFYGEEGRSTWENLESVSNLIEKLQKVYGFVERCHQVIALLFRQLCALLGKGYCTSNQSTCFPELLDCLAELLVCLLTFDSLLSLPIIKDHWLLYRRSIKSSLHNPSKFHYTRDQVRSLDKHLAYIERILLSGNIFKSALEKCMDDKLIMIIKGSNVATEIGSYINQLLQDLERDKENIFFTQVWLQVNALVVLEHYLFGNSDRKIIKRLLEVNKKESACTLCGNVVWYPEVFLLKHVPSWARLIDERAFESARLARIATRSQNLQRESHMLSLQACFWLIEIDKVAKKNMNSFEVRHLQEISNLLVEGIKLVKKISVVVKWITNLHADKGRPMTKSVLLSLCRLVEILKCFQFMFDKKLLPLVYVILLISQHLSHKALFLLHNLRKSLMQEKNYKEQQLDVLSALSVCEQSLKGPNTSQRILIAKLSMSASGLSNDSLADIRSVINRLELICGVHSILNRLCDCSFLYWHQMFVLPVYFSKLIETKADLSRYYLILSALSDCALIAGDKVSALTDACLKKDLFGPLNQIVETNLRLQTHLHLQLPPSDPFKNALLQLNFDKFSPALMDKHYISLKKETENYLSAMFYNLTTVVLHDWRTYGEMRRLARLQYHLDTVEDNLPMQTLEQGLDVLEIMRNINVFVGKYLYNLNTQVFIEESSNNKHLNTINISHVANSIRTHGIGIMNTTVNFTYQFLQKKFYMFSQFMFDEHIKSRLLKDMRFFTEHKVNLNQMYPYERADKFNVGIRNLGLNQNGLSYLDLFRKLITQIGNAMGYIRLIRSGGRRFLADSTCFIPNLKTVDYLDELVKNEEWSKLAEEAATCLVSDVKNLVENFEEATEYFKLLVKVFIPVFRNPSNIHLKNFYIIVPPLTINFVEHSLTCKERLNKKNKNDAAFTDDGFVIGLAYIIELLEQESQFNSLHWFHSVQNKFGLDKKKLMEQQTVASKQDDKLQQTLQLSEKRISAFEREFKLLYYSYSSARAFFQT